MCVCARVRAVQVCSWPGPCVSPSSPVAGHQPLGAGPACPSVCPSVPVSVWVRILRAFRACQSPQSFPVSLLPPWHSDAPPWSRTLGSGASGSRFCCCPSRDPAGRARLPLSPPRAGNAKSVSVMIWRHADGSGRWVVSHFRSLTLTWDINPKMAVGFSGDNPVCPAGPGCSCLVQEPSLARLWLWLGSGCW